MTDSRMAFDEERSQVLLRLYRGEAVTARRRAAFDALELKPGERLLDVGSGPGLFALEAAARVAPDGTVVGVDVSPDMLNIASHLRHQSPFRDVIEFHEGHATKLPVEDASFDVAVSIQVLEYVADIDAALAEMHRALRPGGRVLVWDTDWGGVTVHSKDEARMGRIMRALDEHCQHTALPRTLAPRLRAAGFEMRRAAPYCVLDLDGGPDSVSGGLIPMFMGFVEGRQGVTRDDIEAWAAERQALTDEGAYFFSIPQFYFVAGKPS
jgi:Methylase involved in ubiquinone/menaquinone biosynthesis